MPSEQTFPHENAARFESSVSSTAGAEGFRPDLVEKDYFCSLVLTYQILDPTQPPLLARRSST